MAEAAVKEIIPADDPAGGLLLTVTMGEGLPHVAGPDGDGGQTTPLGFGNRRKIHAAVTAAFQQDLVQRERPALLQGLSIIAKRMHEHLCLLYLLPALVLSFREDFQDFLP